MCKLFVDAEVANDAENIGDADTMHSRDCATATTFLISREQYFRERYKKMTPEERDSKREQQRLNYRGPRRKEAIITGKRRRKKLQKHNLNSESIAMENPLHILEVVWPTADATGPHGSMVNPSGWVIPEYSATTRHISPANEGADEDECGDILAI
jgi:hypothetical protein